MSDSLFFIINHRELRKGTHRKFTRTLFISAVNTHIAGLLHSFAYIKAALYKRGSFYYFFDMTNPFTVSDLPRRHFPQQAGCRSVHYRVHPSNQDNYIQSWHWC